MAHIAIGALFGLFSGFGFGLSVALFSRDGVWPQVWLGMVGAGGACGAVLGAISWAA